MIHFYPPYFLPKFQLIGQYEIAKPSHYHQELQVLHRYQLVYAHQPNQTQKLCVTIQFGTLYNHSNLHFQLKFVLKYQRPELTIINYDKTFVVMLFQAVLQLSPLS